MNPLSASNTGKRIKRHTESPQPTFAAMLRQQSSCSLQQKLKQDPYHHQRRDYLLQSKDAAQQSDSAERQEGVYRNPMFRMEDPEPCRKITVPCRGEGDSRIPQEQRKH